MLELEDERQSLEGQMHRMESELHSFRSQLVDLRHERASLECRVADAEAELSSGAAVVSETALALELLCRLREAVLRAPMSAAEVFRLLAGSSGGRLGAEDVVQVLTRLEANIPAGALATAFRMLDANSSGFVE